MRKYDIAVIGAGSAGLTAAALAKRMGARVVLIEKKKIGGECTHSGCIPSKTFITCARAFHAMKNASSLGLPSVAVDTALDFARVMEHVDSVVQDIYLHEWPIQIRDSGVDVILHPSGAQLRNAYDIQVGGAVIRADYSVICTGSSPAHPPQTASRGPAFLDNETFWKIRALPRSIIFLGGGFVAAELGQALARFGSQVTIIGRNRRFLKAVDKDVSALAADILQREGLCIFTGAEMRHSEYLRDGRTSVAFKQADQEKVVVADAVFAALGRAPNVSGLTLENARVDYDIRRGIHTNQYLQTTSQNIYACGDVTSDAHFSHVAGYQARVCILNILRGNKIVNDLSALPWAIFMEPEIAHVGLSEEQAQEALGAAHVVRVDATLDRFVTEGRTEGFLKIILDHQDRVIGADAIGAHAGEWIQLITLAIKHQLSPQDFSNTIVAYPTHSDIVRKAFSRLLDSRPA